MSWRSTEAQKVGWRSRGHYLAVVKEGVHCLFGDRGGPVLQTRRWTGRVCEPDPGLMMNAKATARAGGSAW